MVDGGLVGVGVDLVVGGKRVEGRVEVVVDLGDVFVEMLAYDAESDGYRLHLTQEIQRVLTDCRKLCAIDAHHAQLADLASSSQVKEREANDADLFVGARHSTADKASGVLAGANLDEDMPISHLYRSTTSYKF